MSGIKWSIIKGLMEYTEQYSEFLENRQHISFIPSAS